MGNELDEINAINQKIASRLYDLFITNTYALAYQRDDGKYITKYLPVTELLVEQMLKFNGSIGCYQQCYKTNMLKWICFDFDCKDKVNPDLYQLYSNYVKVLKKICDEYNVEYLTEFSGRRGIHLWIIFSHLIPKDKAFNILSFLKNKLLSEVDFDDDINLDIFPATDSAKGNVVGKQVKMPLSFHKSGSRSYFFEGNSLICNEAKLSFLKHQLEILEQYKVNDYETIVESFNLSIDDSFLYNYKYKNFVINEEIKLNIFDAINILSETKFYFQLFERLKRGKASTYDRLVIMGTFSPLNDGGEFITTLFSLFPNYDQIKTQENIDKFSNYYYPATFDYLYKYYGLQCEDGLDTSDTGFSYLMKKLGVHYEESEINTFYKFDNEFKLNVEDTINKEKNYFLDNDEVFNVKIWNDLNSFKYLDIEYIEKIIAKIKSSDLDISNIVPHAYTYERKESETKIRQLTSLFAFDRVLTTHCSLLICLKLKSPWKSFSYNVSISNRKQIFYNWFSSWSEYLNRIKTYLELPFMCDYEVITIDLKNFYDNVDFVSCYKNLNSELDLETKYLFRFLIGYNDKLMRKINNDSRKGVPQGPVYARVIAEMYLDTIIKDISKNIDSSKFHLYRYVDDIIIFVEPNSSSREIYNAFVNNFVLLGLPVNESKSKYYGKIKDLTQEERSLILRKDKFTYDLQNLDFKGYISLAEREIDILNYLKSNSFEINDISLFFNKRSYDEANFEFFYKYAEEVMSSSIGRGSSFKKFYTFLFTHSTELNYALDNRLFNLIPINSINFGNMVGELYRLIQNKEINIERLYKIKKEFLSKISLNDLKEEYFAIVKALNKIIGNKYYAN